MKIITEKALTTLLVMEIILIKKGAYMSELTMTTEYGTINNSMEETTMNKSEIVRNYVKANPTPDQDLCPEIVQYWRGKNGRIINQSNKSGVRNPNGTQYGYGYGDDKTYYAVRSYSYEGLYVKYITELKCLEVARIKLAGGRFKENETRDWKYADDDRRMFAFVGDTVAYNTDGTLANETWWDRDARCQNSKVSEGKYYCPRFLKLIHEGKLCGVVVNDKVIAEQIKTMGGKLSEGWHIHDLWAFYRNKWIERKKSAMTVKLDQKVLISVPKELKEVKFSVPDGKSAFVIQKVDDEYIVFRTYDYKACDYNPDRCEYDSHKWIEKRRIFVDLKGKPTVVQKRWRDTEWKISSASIHEWANRDITIIGEELMDEWKPIKYIKNLIDFHNYNAMEQMVQILRHPIIEQISKAGYPRLAKEMCSDNTIAANLLNYFNVKERKQPLYKLLGVNKWLLSEVENYNDTATESRYCWGGPSRLDVIYRIKMLYCRPDISDLSKETVELLVGGLWNISSNDLKEICGCDTWYTRRERWITVSDEDRNFIMKLLRMNKKSDQNMIRLYMDTIRMYQRIDDKPEIDLRRFEDAHGLEIIHDALVAIKVHEDEERQARWDEERRASLEEKKEKFKKLQKDRKERFNTESDNYIIRVPEELEEITKEGVSLHHCVGGYLETHAVGNTNIIFLRRKASPDSSFYTIEVNPNNVLIQIHGSHNKWLGNDPEAIPFVYSWLVNRGITFDKGILLNLGAGYGRAREQLDESWLTKEIR